MWYVLCCSADCGIEIVFNVGVVRVDVCFLFFKQKTAYEVRISDWSSDVCSSDLWERYEKNPSRQNALQAGRMWMAPCDWRLHARPNSRPSDRSSIISCHNKRPWSARPLL